MKPDSILVNLPKNAMQYLIGFGLYLFTFGSFDLIKLILGFSSFLITYSAIYPFNDLMDYESDRKDEFKKVYKALARGDLSPKTAVTMVFAFPIIGLLLASMVNSWYPIILSILLFQNLLHSSPMTTKRWKHNNWFMIPNMFMIQSIKFSLGWLTFTTDLTLMPGWLITTLSSAYIWGYIAYKKGLKNIWKNFLTYKKVMIPLSVFVLASFFITFTLYDIKIPLLMIFPLMLLFFNLRKEKNLVKKTFSMASFSWGIFAAIAFLLLLLNVPFIAEVNQNTSAAFDELGEASLNGMSPEGYEVICKINETLYSQPIKNLEELKELFNLSEMEIVIRNGTLDHS